MRLREFIFSGQKINYSFIIFLIIALSIPAHFINLGMLRFIDDEAIRALVALEMKLSGDWITPTLGGEFYYKKPPLFNWILIFGYSIAGQYNELTPRATNLIFIAIYCLVIYYVVKPRYGHRKAFLSAILFLVSGRVLIYESLFGLIDMFYSLLIFTNFILIYHFLKKEKLLPLFLLSYTITGATFLLKGIPPIAFQGITLLVAAFCLKKFWKLFSWQHIVGVLPFFIITGAYYFTYYKRNPEQFPDLMQTLFHESADKSAVNFGWKDIVSNVFSYSFEVLYNFVPITLVILFFFRKNPFKLFKADPFLKYLALVFIFNIIIYLVSPISYMRYVLMLMPLISIIFVIHYEQDRTKNTWQIKFLHVVFLILPILFFLGMPAFAIVETTGFVSYPWIKAIILMLALAAVIFFMIRQKEYKIEGLILSLLLVRLAFNFFILPSRVHNHWEIRAKEQALEISSQTTDKPLYRYKTWLPLPVLYHATAARQEIIHHTHTFDKPAYYLAKQVPEAYSDSIMYTLESRPDHILQVFEVK